MAIKKPTLDAASFASGQVTKGRQAPLGQVRLNINVDMEKHTNLKMLAAKKRTTIAALISPYIDEILRKG